VRESSVLPTPEGPAKINDPPGRRGSFSPARVRRIACDKALIAWSCPITRWWSSSSIRRSRAVSSSVSLKTGIPVEIESTWAMSSSSTSVTLSRSVAYEKNIINNTEYYIKFKSDTNSITVLNDITVDILVIGGGGGGGSRAGSGGGAGALIYKTNYTLTAGTYTITIGNGGNGGTNDAKNAGLNGEDTAIDNITTTTRIFLAKGGGGGSAGGAENGTDPTRDTSQNGNDGGSGGGGYKGGTAGTKVASNLPQDSSVFANEGASSSSSISYGGGGGGAGGVGIARGEASSRQHGNGGLSKSISITGSTIYYAGGGGAGNRYSGFFAGFGGMGPDVTSSNPAINGGAGNGGSGSNTGGNGLDNTGSGGGGGGYDGSDNGGSGGKGGSGVVIIRMNKNKINLLEYNDTSEIIEENIIDNTDYYITFKSGTINLNVEDNINIDILVVGGGGAGGFDGGGGGGGGEVIYMRNYILEKSIYIFTIGKGGLLTSASGTDTTISKNGSVIISAGGGGGGGNKSNIGKAGTGGGGGGGGHDNGISQVGGSSTKNGGSGGNNGYSSGGGGGSGVNVANKNGIIGTATLGGNGGNGGTGINININGSNTGYGGGGAGGNYSSEGGLATHGGGAGGGDGQTVRNGISGIQNTGGGGGGSGYGRVQDGIPAGSPGLGGSGVIIIRINKNNKNIIIPSSITAATRINIIGYNLDDIIIKKYNNRYYILILGYNDINIYKTEYSKKIKEYLDNHYLNFSNFIIKIDNDTNDISYIYVIDLEEYEKYNNKNNSKIFVNIYNLIKEFFYNINYNIHTVITDNNLTNLLLSTTNNKNYINIFYTTLIQINKNINYFENISKDDIYNQTIEYINNLNLLKFIDVYDNDRYLILKKYIFIKIDNSNELHNYIKNNYDSNKTKKISLLNNESGLLISDIIIDVSGLYLDINSKDYNTKNYFMIDIETINKFINENKNNLNSINVNSYISKIYEDLLNYYNNKINLKHTIDNFDLLFKETKIDKKIKELIDDYRYIYNLIIIIYIILMTIILHIFYIELFRYL